MKFNVAGAFLVAFVLGACDLGMEPEILPLGVSASIAAAPGQSEGFVAMAFEIANGGSSALWVGSCDGEPLVAVERQEGGAWENVSADVCRANVDMAPIEISAGETLAGLRVIEAVPGNYRAIAWGFRHQHHAGVAVISNTVAVE